MSLDVYLKNASDEEVYSSNITHNLNKMALAVSETFYKTLWRPEELGYVRAEDLLLELRKGVSKLVCAPSYFKKYDSPNGWGLYENFVPFVIEYIEACEKNPKAKVFASR